MAAFVQTHQHDAHGGAALGADFVHADAHDLVGRGQQDQAVIVAHGHGPNHRPGLARDLEVDDALAAPRLQAVKLHAGALAVAVGGNGHDLCGLVRFLHYNAGNHKILSAQGYALDAGGHATHGPHVPAREADGDAVGRGQHNMAVFTDGTHHHQFVVLAQAHGHEAGLAAPGVQGRRGALDHAALGHKEEVLVFRKFAQGQYRGDPLVFLKRQQVVDVHALGRTAAFGHLVHLELVHAALVGKEAEILVVGGAQKLLHIVVIRGVQGGNALAAALLLLIVLKPGALHIAATRQGDDHFFIGNEVFDINVRQGLAQHFGAARGHEGFANLADFAPELVAQHFRIFENGAVELNLLQKILVFGHKFIALQAREALQAHFKNGLGLNLGKLKALHEGGAGFLRIGRRADKGHHLVDVVDGNAQTFKNMGAGLGFFKIIAGAADDHLAAMIDKAGKRCLEIKQLRAIVHHRQHIDAKAGFQRRELVQAVDDDVRDGAALEVDDHADALAVGFVAQVGDAVYLAVIDQGRDFFHQGGLVEPVRNLSDDNGLKTLLAVFDFHAATHLNGAAPGVIGVVQPLARIDKAAGGKVRPFHMFHQVVDAALGIIKQQLQGVAQLPKVMGRNVGSHANGNTRTAVEQQVGNLARHNRRFLQGIIVVGAKIHRVLVKVGQKFLSQL